MDRVVPVTPYAPLGDVEEEEKRWLEKEASQRAWAAVHRQEENKPWWQRTGEWAWQVTNTLAGTLSIPKMSSYKLAAPVKDELPSPEEKKCGWNLFCWIGKGIEWLGNQVKSWFEPRPPAPTPDVSAIQTQAVQTVVTGVTQNIQAMLTRTPTATLTPSATPYLQTPTNTFTPTAAQPSPTPTNSATPSATLPPPSSTPLPTPMNPNDQTILERVVNGITEDYTPGTYHYPAEPNLPTGKGGIPGGLNDTNVVD